MPTNGQLRTCQILVFIVTGTAGLVVSISVGWTSRILRGECVLFSDMHVKKQQNGSLLFIEDKTEWGSMMQCSFSTFCPVGVTIYCIIWIWFYIFLSDWGTSFIEDKPVLEDTADRPPPDQHLLIPSIVCHSLIIGLLLATVATVEAGRSEWCQNMEELLEDQTCSYTGHVTWLNLHEGDDLYGYLSHARVSCWVLLFTMILQSIIIFIRLRRNSKRPQLDSTLASEPISEPYTDVFTEPTSEPTSDPFSDSDFSGDDRKPPTRRRLQRQKKVVIDLGENDDDMGGASTGLLQNINEIAT